MLTLADPGPAQAARPWQTVSLAEGTPGDSETAARHCIFSNPPGVYNPLAVPSGAACPPRPTVLAAATEWFPVSVPPGPPGGTGSGAGLRRYHMMSLEVQAVTL